MNLKNKILNYFKDTYSKEIIEINYLYFESLYQKFKDDFSVEMTLSDGVNDSVVIPLPIATDADIDFVAVQDYESLSREVSPLLKDFRLRICKMQAGLGTSVKREDLLKKYTNRKTLGSKGTDLFIEYNSARISIAEMQLLLAQKRASSGIYESVIFSNLINSETEDAVNGIWNNIHPFENKPYIEIFNTEKLKKGNEIYQLMMPTISSDGSVSLERMAPAGHGFLGFNELLEIFRNEDIKNEILVVGNGEDLKSTPDDLILSWIAEKNVPIAMLTTTKLEKDKKGGQIAMVKEKPAFITIVEKAQAEKANQLQYFEELGLRAGDKRSLFNTNIVVINKKALKEKFIAHLNISEEKFRQIISPDLIKNSKKKEQESYTQLEGAIGSSLLNLDKYFRKSYNQNLVSFLNLAPENREKFFVPIKTRDDFDEIYGDI
jgi:UDP-N-acetylglucosamine pyrophosphorylase